MEDRYRRGGSLHCSSDALFAAHKGAVPRDIGSFRVWLASLQRLLEVDNIVVALAFLIPVSCISPFPDGSQGPRWALLSFTPFIALRAKASLPWPAVATISLMLLSVSWSPDPFSGVDLVWHFAMLIVVALIAPVNMAPVYWAIGLGLAVNTVVVMLQLDGWNPVANVGLQATGLFFNRNQQNDFIAMALIGLLSLRDWRAFVLAIFCAIPLVTVPIERAPVIGLAAVPLFLLCRRWPLMIPAAIVLGLGLLAVLIQDPTRMVALTSRIELWGDMAEHMTWIGNGLGSFQWAYPEMERAHNDLLQISYELGIPGFLVSASVMLYCYIKGPVVPRLILVVFAVEGLFDFPLYQPSTGFLAALAAGHLVRARGPLFWRVDGGQCADRVCEAERWPT